MQCPGGSYFVATNNSCMFPPDIKVTCPLYANYNNVTKQCECPQDKPYNN